MTKNAHSNLKKHGIDIAKLYLQRRDYEVLCTSWKCEAGKVDMVARDQDCLVFIKVKTRSSAEEGFTSGAISAKKRMRYEKIAACYLAQHPQEDVRVRFDVVAVVVVSPDRAFIRHNIHVFNGPYSEE